MMIDEKKWYDIILDGKVKWQINLTNGFLYELDPNDKTIRTVVTPKLPNVEVMGDSGIGVRFVWRFINVTSVCNYIENDIEEKNKITFGYSSTLTAFTTTVTDVKTNLRKKHILYRAENTYEEEIIDENDMLLKKLQISHSNNNSIKTIDESTYSGGALELLTQTNIMIDPITENTLSQEVKTYRQENNALVLTSTYTTNYTYTNDKLTKMQDSNGIVTEYIYKNNGDLELIKTYHINDIGNQHQTYIQLISQLQNNNGITINNPNGQVEDISITVNSVLNKNSFTYNSHNLVEKLESGNTKFEYEYDGWGRVNLIKQNNVNYASIEYDGDTITTTHANNVIFKTTSNEYGQPVGVCKVVNNVDNPILSYAYNSDQKLTTVTDHIENKVIDIEQLEMPELVGQIAYDNLGRFTVQKILFGGSDKLQHDIHYRGMEIAGPGSAISTTNAVGQEDFIFVKNNTQLYEQTLYMYGNSFYDNKENITSITENDGVNIVGGDSFVYDDLNRLVGNGQLANHVTYEYDGNGNIQNKKKGVNIVATYTYDINNQDRLTSYNGETCAYDDLGNPTTYRNKAAVWENVGQLKSLDGVSFTYNGFGLRTQKQQGNKTVTYSWQGGLLVSEQRTTSNVTQNIEYTYSQSGVIGFKLNGTQYYYRKNALGDVSGILNENGEYVAKYTYNAWGEHTVQNFTVDNIGNINAIRYRGYYWDSEINLYYLHTRYYDPETCRFISVDSIGELRPDKVNGLNLYAYCGNNPVMNVDFSGTKGLWNWVDKKIIKPFGKAVVDAMKLCYEIGMELIVNPIVATAETVINIATGADSPFKPLENWLGNAPRNLFNAVSIFVDRNQWVGTALLVSGLVVQTVCAFANPYTIGLTAFGALLTRIGIGISIIEKFFEFIDRINKNDWGWRW
ncbi:MAG: RHS repeat-associated core domain-containing protein [Firmicutes bacterium]|nr:RHS repeat-associated core domain-containing protein [Bacillota bacterium]